MSRYACLALLSVLILMACSDPGKDEALLQNPPTRNVDATAGMLGFSEQALTFQRSTRFPSCADSAVYLPIEDFAIEYCEQMRADSWDQECGLAVRIANWYRRMWWSDDIFTALECAPPDEVRAFLEWVFSESIQHPDDYHYLMALVDSDADLSDSLELLALHFARSDEAIREFGPGLPYAAGNGLLRHGPEGKELFLARLVANRSPTFDWVAVDSILDALEMEWISEQEGIRILVEMDISDPGLLEYLQEYVDLGESPRTE